MSSATTTPSAAPETSDDGEVARALQEEYNRETNELRSGRGWADPLDSDYRQSGYQQPGNGEPLHAGLPGQGAYCPVICSTCKTVNHVPYTPGWAVFRCTQCAFQNRADLRIRARRERDWFDDGMPFLFCTIS